MTLSKRRSAVVGPQSLSRLSRSSPRLLIYGFGPYRSFENNITERILRRVPSGTAIQKIVFPVRFNRTQFTEPVEKFKPDVILGMGQCSTGRLLRLETRAVNERRSGKTEPARPISRGGASTLRTNLALDLRKAARRSRSAGDYVCNFSMYVILDFLRRRGMNTRFGFIHIPCMYDETKAVHLLTRVVRKFQSSSV